MSELVIDRLEVVDVDGDHGGRAGELAEAFLERAPVADLGQRVGGRVQRLLLEEAGAGDGHRGLVGDRLHDGQIVDVPGPAARVGDEHENSDHAPAGGTQRRGDDASRAPAATETLQLVDASNPASTRMPA